MSRFVNQPDSLRKLAWCFNFMTNLLEFPKIMCYHQSKSMYCDTKHETNNCCVNFTFETKKLKAKNLLLRLDFDENQIRCNIMKFVYRCDEVSIWM